MRCVGAYGDTGQYTRVAVSHHHGFLSMQSSSLANWTYIDVKVRSAFAVRVVCIRVAFFIMIGDSELLF